MQDDTLRLLQWDRLCEQVAQFAQTESGGRNCLALQPASTEDAARYKLQQTREARLLETQLAQGLPLGGIRDIQAVVRHAQVGGLLEGMALLAIASTLAAARKVRRVIEDREDIPLLLDLVETLRTCPELEQRINFCLDDSGQVMDRASPALAEARSQQQRLREKVQKTLQSLLQRQANSLQEQLITERDGRFVVLVKVNAKDQVPGIVHDTSASGQTLFVEPLGVIEDQNRIRQWQRTEQQEVERVLWELSGLVAAEYPALSHLIDVLTTLDGATARARHSLWVGAVEPVFHPHLLELRSLSHPLLVAQSLRDPSRTVVPIHIFLEPPVRGVVITGPNTGGKTLTLKSVGIAVLMAKAGLFVVATSAVVPWCERVLADIGDEQSLEQNLSTFSSHVRRIVGILQEVGPRDLVLLDEVGAGTDPQEGSALAAALLQHLIQVSRFTLATTHYGALKALKYQDPRFENASVEFDEQSLAPTYRLLWGIPGRSNALNIARRLGLDSQILAEAQSWLSPQSLEANTVIAGLEAQRRQQEQSNQRTQQLNQDIEKVQRELVSQKEALLRERLQLQQQEQQQLQESIAGAKTQIARVIRQLQANPTAQQAQQATRTLTELEPKTTAHTPENYRPQMGDRVQVLSLGQTGEVLTVTSDGQAQVRCGVLKLLVPVDQLWPVGVKVPAQRLAPPPQPSKPPPPPPAVRTSQNTIDIRGQRVADLDLLLEDRLAAHHGAVWIIHGHGTGRLRTGVHEFLKSYSRTQSFAPAAENEGGSGATVVQLTP
ncbi:endonuclease MutS2 [Candidatus Cyanaurora vandensis]|uniref:endonuclease MutS2 n=3 Tax=Candidatus Cyanaurora vandensis TaxID=2714958 RepID=UPI00257B46CF|nr:endonuclease MutS2 [Candidatus Cyanaurora vandensis]